MISRDGTWVTRHASGNWEEHIVVYPSTFDLFLRGENDVNWAPVAPPSMCRGGMNGGEETFYS
jgi:hypothetical protein